MTKQQKPRIGLLGIMQELYDDDIPNITQHQEKYARQVCDQLDEAAEWIFPRAARNRDDIEDILGSFNQQGLDGVMIVMLTYSPGMRSVRALQHNRLPLLLANIQPVPEVTTDWNMDDLTYNQGIHGAQDMANTMLRTLESSFEVITDDWQSDIFKKRVGDWAKAAQVAAALKKMKIASIGKMHGMGDTLTDEAAFTRIVGPAVNREDIGKIYRRMEAIPAAEIKEQMKVEQERFEIDDDMPNKNLEYAVKMYLGFKKFLQQNGYAGFSAHFDVFKGDGRFEQINMFAASNLMAEGYGYAAEGDTNTASIMAAGHILGKYAHFTEMYAMDFERSSVLMSHMGEGNWRVARKDEPIRLANRKLGIGDLNNPPTTVFRAEPGPATIVSLVHMSGEKFHLVAAQGTILDSQKYPTIEMPYLHFKPDSGLKEFNNGWLKAGGTHHQTLLKGDYRHKWEMLCRILNIEYVEV